MRLARGAGQKALSVAMNVPIFVISLPGSPRRETMTRQMARWGGRWSFVDAVDGRTLSAEELNRVYDEKRTLRRIGRPMSKGEIGTALSHASIYRRMEEEGIPRALILEDDAVLSSAFFDFPFGDISWPFDLISFFTDHAIVRRAPSAELAGVGFHRAEWRSTCSVAYLISLDGARKLAAAGKPIQSVADWPLRVSRLVFYVAQPFIVDHHHEKSTLQSGRNQLLRQYPKQGRLPRFVVKYFDLPITVLFLRYAINYDRYDGFGHYISREIRPFVLRRWSSRYLFIRRKQRKTD